MMLKDIVIGILLIKNRDIRIRNNENINKMVIVFQFLRKTQFLSYFTV